MTKLIACVSENAMQRATHDEIVTLECRISLTRKQWGNLAHRMTLKAALDRIGMAKMNENDLIVLQVMQQHIGGEK